jgi:hypothetical protein
LCGALPDDQHQDTDCEGNAEAMVQAAGAEIDKIMRLRRELDDTMSSLNSEREQLSASLQKFQDEYDAYDNKLGEIVAPAAARERASYKELMAEKASITGTLDKFDRLHQLTAKRDELVNKEKQESKGSTETETRISKTILEEYSQKVEEVLEEWHFPNASRVFFDESKRDFQIDGKERGSTGKGLRAITHAAASIALMEFCREHGLPHPGFVVLDSPLLAYWKPEGEEDNLSGTDLDKMFYRYLLGLHEDNQVIILENKHPPGFVMEEGHVTVFTKNPHKGRYGFFPYEGN